MSAMLGKGVQWVLAILGIVFVLMIFAGKDAGVDGGLYITYTAFFLCAGMAVLFGLYSIVTAGKKAMPTLIGIGVFLVLLAISYGMASDSVLPAWQEMGITPSASKMVGAGLGVLYIMMGGAVVAILAGEVMRLLK
ncbi:MAG: hypothetical protein KDB88_04830 [Flavobacteriales bacterium]|nr:hypothetical protein [Flavobacteriales bacterium]